MVTLHMPLVLIHLPSCLDQGKSVTVTVTDRCTGCAPKDLGKHMLLHGVRFNYCTDQLLS